MSLPSHLEAGLKSQIVCPHEIRPYNLRADEVFSGNEFQSFAVVSK
jgi:hypothetical protein